MAYKCTFMDNVVYSASDLNEVFSKLTSSGVVLFADTGNVLSDINAAVSNFTAEGVTLNADSCKVIKSGGTFKISPGECFMNDGSLIIFDESGYELEITEGVACYVYIMRSPTANTIVPIVSAEPGGSGTVSLASIDESGNITDTRSFASAKVAPPWSNVSNYSKVEGYIGAGSTVTVDMGFEGFKYIMFLAADPKRTEAVDLSDGEYHAIYALYGTTYKRAEVRKEGSKLIFRPTESAVYVDMNLSFEVR